MTNGPSNLDEKTVAGFGREWTAFDQTEMEHSERQRLFDSYFSIFPWERLPPNAEGFDLGCGSGRWAKLVAPRIGRLWCIDASPDALDVARKNLEPEKNVEFQIASVDAVSLNDGSQDFGYSLGVLHHVPDTAAGIASCVRKLKPGAPFLLYLYYRLENRPLWFRALWQLSNVGRRIVSALPFPLRRAITTPIGLAVYWPLSRIAWVAEKLGMNVTNWPLSAYRNLSIYTMKTDALDRFGTRLEKRFTRLEIERMMQQAGLERIRFRDSEPYWTAVGFKIVLAIHKAHME